MIDVVVAENLWNEMLRTLVRGLERRSARLAALTP